MDCIPFDTFMAWLTTHPVSSTPLADGHMFVLESLRTGNVSTWVYEPLVDAFCRLMDHKA